MGHISGLLNFLRNLYMGPILMPHAGVQDGEVFKELCPPSPPPPFAL